MSPELRGRLFESWIGAADSNRGSDEFNVSLSAFRAILDGRAPLVSEVASACDLSPERYRSVIRALAEQGRVTLEHRAERITGAGGLSLVESRHVLDMNGRRFWVWCALDAVGIPVGLEVDATVISNAVDTNQLVRIEITSGVPAESTPSDLVVSLVEPSLSASLHECCCSLISFYSSPNAVPASTEPVTIEQAMSLGRQLWRDGSPL